MVVVVVGVVVRAGVVAVFVGVVVVIVVVSAACYCSYRFSSFCYIRLKGSHCFFSWFLF